MGQPNVSHAPRLFLSIGDGQDAGYMFEKFEWKSFINEGYVVRAKLIDPYWNIIRDLATTTYLSQGRRKPTKVTWEIEWPTNEKTGKHIGYITDLDARGINSGGKLEFIAVDPPSYWLNAGDSSGKQFEGNLTKVIEDVINQYFIGPNGNGKKEVSQTSDDQKGSWWMMRMDPKTFLSSLLEWSASLTKGKTNWIVSSSGSVEDEPTIWVKEQADRKSEDYGLYVLDMNTPAANDAYNFEFLSDNFISVFQRQMITQGISRTSGKFYDRITDQDRKIVHVDDTTTGEKKKVDIDAEHGFAKPGAVPSAMGTPHEWSTSLMAVPQHNAGDIGVKYKDYIDGRARSVFLNMLRFVMRIKLRVNGDPSKTLANSHNLGVSKLKIAWIDGDGKSYFLDGEWLVYGFHHLVTRGDWYTDLYCYRTDYDSSGQNV
jgi:hypothetical protein